jgi:hypothetical protein
MNKMLQLFTIAYNIDQGPYFKDPRPWQFNVYIYCHKEAEHRPGQTVRKHNTISLQEKVANKMLCRAVAWHYMYVKYFNNFFQINL